MSPYQRVMYLVQTTHPTYLRLLGSVPRNCGQKRTQLSIFRIQGGPKTEGCVGPQQLQDRALLVFPADAGKK